MWFCWKRVIRYRQTAGLWVAESVETDEQALTGESQPVAKSVETVAVRTGTCRWPTEPMLCS
jgi:magnesium-transporting ATPase (P-type)